MRKRFETSAFLPISVIESNPTIREGYTLEVPAEEWNRISERLDKLQDEAIQTGRHGDYRKYCRRVVNRYRVTR